MEVLPHSPDDLKELNTRIRKEKDVKQRDRYRAVLLALQGNETLEIQSKIGRSRGFVQRWVYAYRDNGIDGIRVKIQIGQPTKLPREKEPLLLERIDKAPENLRGQDIAAILENEFGVSYTLQGVYDLLHRLNYTPLRPRPVNPKKDIKKQEQWKGDAPFLSDAFKKNGPTKK